MKILTNGYKHCILAGENYMECQYLEKTRETKKFIQYKKLATKVYITPDMVMSPDVRITSDYKVLLNDFIALADKI